MSNTASWLARVGQRPQPPKRDRKRRKVRHPFIWLVVLALIVWLTVAFISNFQSPRYTNEEAPTPATTIQQSINQQYGRDCGNYSPTKDDLSWFYSANDGNADSKDPSPGSYGALGTGSGQVSCPPAWVTVLKTNQQLQVAWYGHACGDYSPSPGEIHYFFYHYAHIFTCDQGRL